MSRISLSNMLNKLKKNPWGILNPILPYLLFMIKTDTKKRFIFTSLIVIILAVISSVLKRWVFHIILLSENQIYYVYSVATQGLAALLGLIFTGYIFYRNYLLEDIEKNINNKRILTEFGYTTYREVIRTFIHGIIAFLFSLLCLAWNDKTGIFFDTLLNFTTYYIVVTLFLIFDMVQHMLHPETKKEFCRDIIRRKYVIDETSRSILDYDGIFLDIANTLDNICLNNGIAEKSYNSI